jgi:tetratricopeptide (TPR) repeat protein
MIMALRAFVYLPLVCEWRATGALYALENAGEKDERTKLEAARFALGSLGECATIPATDFKVPYELATAYRYRHEPQSAITLYKEALALDRRPEIYFGLGMAQLDAGERAAAIETFTEATAFAPTVLADIPYDEVRAEVAQRIRATYGADWIR